MPGHRHVTGEAIHVAVVTDGHYVMALAAMLASLAERVNAARPLVLHVLTDRVPEALWSRLVHSVPAERVWWNRLEVNSDELVRRGFSTRSYGHISPVTYVRLLLPELLPGNLDKVLYLDADLIVCDDIAPLWDTDIASVGLAAAGETDLTGKPLLADRLVDDYGALGMSKDSRVFNVGVLLINLRYWREQRIAERCFGCLRTLGTDLHWYDQDALNIIINGEYRELPARWNARPDPEPGASSHPSIIHFLTAQKPWHWDYRGSFADRFFASLDRTPWAGWRPERPRLATPRLLLKRASRGARKARDYVVARAARLRRRLRPRLSRFPGSRGLRGSLPPGKASGEIRVFLVLPLRTEPSEVEALLAFYGGSGVDRAFGLDCTASGLGAGRWPGVPFHLFRAGPGAGPAGHSLRLLLERYGSGGWWGLGAAGETLRGEDSDPLDLRQWCARLDTEGCDAGEARTGTTRAARIEQIGRDLRTGRPFRGTALVETPDRAWDLPRFGSRVAVLKYRKTMFLDQDLVLVGNARKSNRLLRSVARS